MVKRLTLTLEQPEYSALLKVAMAELRNPQDQARYILRRDLENRGLIPSESQQVVRGSALREVHCEPV